MSAVLATSDTATRAQLLSHARHTDHYAERSVADARELKAREQEYRAELGLVQFGAHDTFDGVEL